MGCSPVDLLKQFGEISQLGQNNNNNKLNSENGEKKSLRYMFGFLYRDLFPPFFEK